MKKFTVAVLGTGSRGFVYSSLMKERTDEFEIASAATSTEELGNSVYPPARRLLQRKGIDCSGKRARQITPADYAHYDLIIGMDDSNFSGLCERAPGLDEEAKIHRMTEYCTHIVADHVPDPYYGGAQGFENVIDILEDACEGLLKALR